VLGEAREQDVIQAFSRTRAATISLLALFVYEYLITLFDEIRYVWKHKYSIATILFAVNRYIVWIEITLQLYISFGNMTSDDQYVFLAPVFSWVVTDRVYFEPDVRV